MVYDSVFKHRKTLKASTDFYCAASYNGTLYTVQNATASSFNGFNLLTGAENSYKGVTVTNTANNGSMVIVNGASAVWDSSANNQIDFVQLSTGYYRQHTTGSPAFAIAYKAQTICWNPRDTSGRYLIKIGNSTAGALTYFDTNTWTSTNVGSLGGGSGDGFYAIIPHPTTANYVVSQATSTGAANNPRIKEFSFNGSTFTLQKTITVDMTSKRFPIGNTNAGKLTITSLAMSTDGNYLVCGDTKGLVYLYDYNNSILLDKVFLNGFGNIGAGDGIVLTTLGSSMFAATSGGGTSATPKDISLLRIDNRNNTLQILEHQTVISGEASKNIGFDEASNSIWMQANNEYIHVYDMPMPYTSTVQTRIQDPPGTDVAGRIIRIRNLPAGKSYVAIDQNISAGAQNVNVTSPGDYYEIALTGSGPTLKWDWRRMNL